MLVRRVPHAVAAVTALVTLGACAQPLGGEGPEQQFYAGHSTEEVDDSVRVDLIAADGGDAGIIEVRAHGDVVEVHVEASNLLAGNFHGFHVHEVGECDPDSADPEDPSTTGAFLSAGGHLSTDTEEHGGHTGDMPSLYANSDGTAAMQVELDGITLDDLRDADGSAFVIHDGPDNFANIPERYAPDGPDEETLSTGDSGDRIVCGVVDPG